MPRVRVACCQLDVVVGDLDGNVARVLAAYQRAEAAGADLAVFGELTLTGYPPEDLLLKPGFVRASHEALSKVAAGTGRCAAVVGFVEAGQDLYNAAAVCAGTSGPWPSLGSFQGSIVVICGNRARKAATGPA